MSLNEEPTSEENEHPPLLDAEPPQHPKLSIAQSLPDEDDDDADEDVEVAPKSTKRDSVKAVRMAETRKTFSSLLEEFRNDKSAQRFMEEYEKLYEALKESRKEVKTLQFRCANLMAEIKNNSEKVNLAIHLSQEDRGMITTLHKQMQQAWMLVDALAEREAIAKRAVISMKDEIEVLTSLVTEGMGLDEVQMLSDKAANERKEMEKEIAGVVEEKKVMKEKFQEVIARMKEREQMTEKEIKDLKDHIDKMKQQAEEERASKDQLVVSMAKVERQAERLRSEKRKLELDVELWRKKSKKTERLVLEKEEDLARSNKINKMQQEFNRTCQNELKTLKNKMENMTLHMKLQAQVIDAHIDEARRKDFDMQGLHHELDKRQKVNSGLNDRCAKLTLELKSLQATLDRCKDDLRLEFTNLKRMSHEVKEKQQQLDATIVKNSSMVHRMSQLEKDNVGLKITNNLMKRQAKESTTLNHVLTKEIMTLNESVRRVSNTIISMVSEKDRLLRRINQGLNQMMQLENEIFTKNYLLLNFKKVSLESDSALKTTQQSLVHALNKRDSLTFDLKHLQFLNYELSTERARQSKAINSVYEDGKNKEHKISRLMAENEKLREDLNVMNGYFVEEQTLNKENRYKIRLLQSSEQEAGDTMHKMRERMEDDELRMQDLCNQRNMLGLECVKKKEMVCMLLEKNQVLEDIMKMGNKLYNERLREIRVLRTQISDLFRQKHDIMKKQEKVETYKSHLGLANQQLVGFQARCKALEGEASMNIHKWRDMKANNVSKFEMVLKLQYLTKRLIMKTDHVAHLEGLLKEKAMIVQRMKGQLERLPKEEVVLKATLERQEKDKMKRKLKLALAEINMVEWKAQEREAERDKLKKELDEERKKRLQQEKKCQKEKLNLPPIQTPVIQCGGPPIPQVERGYRKMIKVKSKPNSSKNL